MSEYVNIRDHDLLGSIIGSTVVDVTQQDSDEFAERGSFVALHFSNGMTAVFPINDFGFVINAIGDDSVPEDDGGEDNGPILNPD